MNKYTRFILRIIGANRTWHNTAQSKFKLHPAVIDCMHISSPKNIRNLLIEYPHKSSDGKQIAYYQNEEKGYKGIATTGKIGKFLTRHFPTIKDTIIRDIVAVYTVEISIVDSMDEMLNVIINGPGSCMANDDFPIHPYKVYDPVYGWKMAVRTSSDGEITGRALINEDTFVRCYAKSVSGNVYASGADNMLESWLLANGFKKINTWKNKKIKKIEHRCRIVAPYLDGNDDELDDCGEYFTIVPDGEYKCDSTGGFADDTNSCRCADCGCRMSEDDGHYISDWHDGSVCDDCIQEYTYIHETRVNGRYKGGFYVPNCEAIETVEGESYPADCFTDYNIVELHDGRYTELDNAVFDEDSGEYYHTDEIGDSIEYCEDDNCYHSEYWECIVSNNYYSDNEEYKLNSDGDKVHPDHFTEDDTDDEPTSEELTVIQAE
jgi:hypothetical protein